MTLPSEREYGRFSKLTWPPSNAELRRLYLDQWLSARKIAELYESCSPNRVRRLLKKHGIPTRPSGYDHPKTTPDLVAEWVRRYQAGESTCKIAGGVISSATVRYHLLKHGVQVCLRPSATSVARLRRDVLLFGEDGAEIKRLYLDERLSCLQIAKRLGLRGESEPKAAWIVQRRLKELGVKIHPRGSLNKRFDRMAPSWVKRYQSGESPRSIAKGVTVDSTVVRYLRELGVELRNASEAHMKYPKSPFNGDALERAYLLGFTRGDLHTERLSGLIRCTTGSTHAAQLDLFTRLFAPFGSIKIYPSVTKCAGFIWQISTILDLSFDFLLAKSDTSRIHGHDVELHYLGGLSDSEGWLSLKDGRVFSPYWGIGNTDPSMLDWAMGALTGLGFHPKRTLPSPSNEAQVILHRNQEVVRLLEMMPLRHPEKRAKARIVLDQQMNSKEKRDHWDRLLADIKSDRDQLTRAAENELAKKGMGATNSAPGLMACLGYLVRMKKFPLGESIWVETLNWLSEYIDY